MSVLLLCLCFAIPASGQLRGRKSETSTPPPIAAEIRATPAYAEVVLRKTELESMLEELLVSYQEEFPKVRNTRYELGLLEAELAGMGRFTKDEAGKLTLALGKLIVRRAELRTEYWIVTSKYDDTHPDTKKAKRKLEIFDKAIKDII